MSIPEELKNERRFVCYDRQKRPINALTGSLASTTDKCTWCSYDEAVAGARKYKCKGIGFVLGDGYCGVDIDTCADPNTEYISEEALEVINTLDTYTEWSISKYGFHAILKASDITLAFNKKKMQSNGIVRPDIDLSTAKQRTDKDGNPKFKTPELEIYNKDRFFILTGYIYGEHKQINERTEELKQIIAKYEDKALPAPLPFQANTSTHITLDEALKLDKVLSGYWHGGRPHGDESADDMGFMAKLLYWLKADIPAACEAFLSSPYAMQKDAAHQRKIYRKDYLERTAKAAMPITKYDVFGRSEYIEQSIPLPKTLETVSAVSLQNKDLSPLRFVVDKLLPQGLAILASPPKYGKSWFVLDLCLSVAAGREFLKHNTNECGCLYLALEDSLHRLKDRMNKILGQEKAPSNFDYAIKSYDISNGLIEQLTEYLKEKPNTCLIVIDTLQKVRGTAGRNETAYGNDYREVGALKALADEHKICILLVHHLRKMSDDGDVFNRISGTNGIMGAADTMFVLARQKRADTETTLASTGRDIESNETLLEFDKNSYKWRVLGNAEEQVAQRQKDEYMNSPIVSTIRKLLKDNVYGWSGTATELSNHCIDYTQQYINDTPSTFSKTLKALAPKLYEYDGILYKPPGSNSSNGKRKHTFMYYKKRTLSFLEEESV